MAEKKVLIINSAGVRVNKADLHSKYLPFPSAVLVAHLKIAGFCIIHKDLRNRVSPQLPEQLDDNDFEQYLEYDKKTDLMQKYLNLAFREMPDLDEIGLIGISVFAHVNYAYAMALAKEIKRRFPALPICIGGGFITIKELEIPSFVDYFVKGNGGMAIVTLAGHHIRGEIFDNTMPGLHCRIDGKRIANGHRYDSADDEEMPDYSDLDYKRYLRDSEYVKKEKILYVPYRTNLGCGNRCSFCTGRLVDKLQFKKETKVVRELEELSKIYENIVLEIWDASINNSPKIINGILNKIIEKGIRLQWRTEAKIHGMSIELLQKLAKTGCKRILWGLEAASPHMIEVYNKRYSITDAEKYIQQSSDLGIINEVGFIFNGPGETGDDLAAVEKFVEKFIYDRNVIFIFNEFYLEENSNIYNNPAKYGIQIISRKGKDKYTSRERIEWRPIQSDFNEFEKQQKKHRQIINNLKCKIYLKRRYAGHRYMDKVPVWLLLRCYKIYHHSIAAKGGANLCVEQ